ncbi:transposase [Enterococcus plantarum]|uniref:transposase n=1 Tax=Enterococcus plantarum TaxID=1077675 RepID=UPI001A901C47|nr:transposase [Enterococcus plantarum]MBO0422201.1 transposase [Enterococcus plantarum]
MQTKNTATRYSKEFREYMIAFSQTGRSVNSLSKEYNVSVSTLAKWISQADPFDQNVSIKERELLKENKRLKEEIDILKRSAVLLAKN